MGGNRQKIGQGHHYRMVNNKKKRRSIVGNKSKPLNIAKLQA